MNNQQYIFRKKLLLIVKYSFLSLMAFFCIFPVYFAISASFKTTDEIIASKLAFPTSFAFDNYVQAWNVGNVGKYFVNSLFVTLIAMAVLAVIGVMASYALVRFKFRFQGFLFTFFVAGLMIPMQSTIIPLAYTLGKFSLKDNYVVLILLYIAFQLPITILIISGFIRSTPVELEEAAVIDGCNSVMVCARIIFPISAPAIVTASIFNLINIWNNLLFPLIFISNKDMQLMSYGLLSFFSEWQSDYGGVMAAISMAILPLLFIYICLQEKVEQGMLAGAVKG